MLRLSFSKPLDTCQLSEYIRLMNKGFEFDHPRVINLDRTPMRYVVTRVAQGAVYFRPIDGGNSEYIEIDKFLKWLDKGT